MLTLNVATEEGYNEATRKFVPSAGYTLVLEHSLVSLSKWESHFEKPFLGAAPKTSEETMWYIDAMRISPEVSPDYSHLTAKHLDEINRYINAKMTATTFSDKDNSKKSREIITAEIIYHWMISFNIPLEWETRHLNRLLTLVRICNLKSQPAKKMGVREVHARQRALNEQRKAQMGTRG